MCASKRRNIATPQENASEGWSGFTRREFIKTWSAGTMALAVGRSGLASTAPQQPEKALAADGTLPLRLNVNGRVQPVLVEPRWTLLYVLREQMGLTAAKIGCERGECGACTVLINNRPRYACLTLALEAEGARIETAEGLLDGEELGQVQASFLEEDGLQCGYCTPGQIMAAEGLLRRNPSPSFDEIRVGMSGNLCRCGAYASIFNAVAAAAKHRKG